MSVETMNPGSRSSRRGLLATGGALVAAGGLTLAMIPFAGSAGAASWTSEQVATSGTRLADTSTNPTGRTYLAWADGTSVKVSYRSSSGWSSPTTVYSNARANEIIDVDILATADSIAVTAIEIEGNNARLKAVAYDSSSSSWSSADTIAARSSGSPGLRNADLAYSGARYYVSFERFDRSNPDGAIRNIYSAEFYQSIGARNDWSSVPSLDEANQVEQGSLVPSGNRYLAYAWLDGNLAKIAFYDLNGNEWNPDDVRTVNTIQSPASSISLSGSSSRSSSGATGVFAYNRSSSTSSRVYVTTLADERFVASRSLPNTGTRRTSDIVATWSSSADRGAVAYATSERSTYAAIINGSDGSGSQSQISEGVDPVRDLTIGSSYADSDHAVTVAWQRGLPSTGSLHASRYSAGSWSTTPASLGNSSDPMVAGSSTPMILAWGTSNPYVLRAYRYVQAPAPTPTPTPEPADPSILIMGERKASKPKRIVITGMTTDIAQGSTIRTYLRMVKDGKPWMELRAKTLTGGESSTLSFRVTKNKTRTNKAYQAYVTIGNVTSNLITIPRAQ